MTLRALVLREMGIECEEETFRALKSCGIEDVQYFGLSELFNSGWQERVKLDAQTWVWLPGGFSFSDDFGAGTLLAYWLREHGFLKEVFKKGAHLTGICNGFQALCAMDVFGAETRLLPNSPRGFVNRWVQVAFEHRRDTLLTLPVRHGEGRLVVKDGLLPDGVEPFLYYRDDNFQNGSHERLAGIRTQIDKSLVFGMMPHPEIALRPVDAPGTAGTSRMPKFRSEIFDLTGPGYIVIKHMMDFISRRSPQS